MRYLLSQIAQICGGELLGTDRIVEDLLTDSRRSGRGEQTLFVAMSGRNHDSHDFLGEMLRRGFKAFLIEKSEAALEGGSYVVVANSLKALQTLASHHRSSFSGEVVAIIGSNGKTLVKEWVAQSYDGEQKIYRSPRSYNSQLGVAISLLLSSGDESLVIIEAGVSRVGEMEHLEKMIRPSVVVLTSLGDAHQEGFDSLEQKLEQKMIMAKGAAKVIYHSAYEPLKQYFSAVAHNYELIDAAAYPSGDFDDPSSLSNSQLVSALLELLVLKPYDLSNITPVAMRLELKQGLNNSIILNDSYNSCVNSLQIALDTLNSVAAGRPTTLILSPILQSGVSDKELYAEIAEVIEAAGVDRVIGVGSNINRWLDCTYFSSTGELLAKISREDYAARAILVKGNRQSRLERVSHALELRSHTTKLEIDLEAMIENLNYFRARLDSKVKMVAMVKANSYGAGNYEIAKTLQDQGLDFLAVAFVDEGVVLRERGISMPIIVLNADDDSFEPMIQMRLEPEIYSPHSLEQFVQALQRNGERRYPIHLKLDTGMHRLGFDSQLLGELLQLLEEHKDRVQVVSIFSHLSSADDPQADDVTLAQIELFEAMSGAIIDGIGYKPMRHIANSAAIERLPQAQFEACRLGIGLYGFGAGENHLTPIATLKSRIVQVKTYPKGSAIGYGGVEILQRDSRVATVPIGYADGLRRDLGCGRWEMIVNGAAAPIVGRVCMDSVMIDITEVPNAVVGDNVTIFSAQKGNTVQDMANVLGTIPYEILTSISQRVKRVYLKE